MAWHGILYLSVCSLNAGCICCVCRVVSPYFEDTSECSPSGVCESVRGWGWWTGNRKAALNSILLIDRMSTWWSVQAYSTLHLMYGHPGLTAASLRPWSPEVKITSLSSAFQPSGPASWKQRGVWYPYEGGGEHRHLFSLGQRGTASGSGERLKSRLLWSATTHHIWILYAYNKVLTLTLYMQH
jgi:hypothetical protein